MSNPRATLRTLIDEPFCYDYLLRIQKAVGEIEDESPGQQVACFVIRQVCLDLMGLIDGIEPISKPDFEVIEGQILSPLVEALQTLALNSPTPIDGLARLIGVSKQIRTSPRPGTGLKLVK